MGNKKTLGLFNLDVINNSSECKITMKEINMAAPYIFIVWQGHLTSMMDDLLTTIPSLFLNPRWRTLFFIICRQKLLYQARLVSMYQAIL